MESAHDSTLCLADVQPFVLEGPCNGSRPSARVMWPYASTRSSYPCFYFAS